MSSIYIIATINNQLMVELMICIQFESFSSYIFRKKFFFLYSHDIKKPLESNISVHI